MKPRIYGAGNPDAGDDAAGLLVAEELRAAGIPAVLCGGDLLSLLDDWQPGDSVILVDAMASGEAAGTVRVWADGEVPFAPGRAATSTHGFGVKELIDLSRALGRAPASLRVYGIAGERFAPGDPVSPAVRRAAGEVAALIREEWNAAQ